MQNDKLVTNSFDFSSVSFSLEEVPCSVQRVSVNVIFSSHQIRRELIRLSRIRANATTAAPV